LAAAFVPSFPIGLCLIPSGFRGSSAERFFYSAIGLSYPIGLCLIPSGFYGSSTAG